MIKQSKGHEGLAWAGPSYMLSSCSTLAVSLILLSQAPGRVLDPGRDDGVLQARLMHHRSGVEIGLCCGFSSVHKVFPCGRKHVLFAPLVYVWVYCGSKKRTEASEISVQQKSSMLCYYDFNPVLPLALQLSVCPTGRKDVQSPGGEQLHGCPWRERVPFGALGPGVKGVPST